MQVVGLWLVTRATRAALAAAGLVAAPVNGSGVPSGIVSGSVRIRAVGATGATVRLNDTVAV